MHTKKLLTTIAVVALMVSGSLFYNIGVATGALLKNVPANTSDGVINDQENPSTVLVGSALPSSVQASNQLGVSGDSSIPTNGGTSATTPTTTTTITITTDNANPAANQPFTLSGTLKAGTTPLSGKAIVLHMVDPSGKWTQVNTTTTTDANGAYTITRSDSQGKYNYYAVFAGDTTYGSSNAFVSVTVGV